MKTRLKSLSAVLSIFFTICLTLIVTVVASVILFTSNQAFESSYEQESKTAIQGFESNIESYSSKVQGAAVSLSNSQDLIEAVKGKNEFTMMEMLKTSVKNSGLSYAFVLDPHGEVLAASTNDFTVPNYAKLVHVQAALQQKSQLTNEAITDKNLCICYGMPLIDNGTLVGVVSTVRSYVDTATLDQLKNYTGCEFTVFYGDERAATTLMKDGKRQTGTKMPADISKTVLTRKKEFTGRNNILGANYMSDYSPIIGPDGKTVGALFAGKNIDAADKTSQMMVMLAVGISVLMVVIAIIILRIFVKRLVKKPLEEVVVLANHMERGEIGITDSSAVELSVRSDNEVGQVASALQNTVRSLQGYIGEIRAVLNAISTGDLTATTKGEYYGDFSEIKNALNQITGSLNGVFFDINRAAESVALRSDQISTGAMAMSQGATEQASAAEELSATISEISEQVHKTAESAAVASQTAQKSFDEVEKGNQNVETMMKSMSDISTASTKIGKIIKTIEDIAFQTNILALNAAVEAARAGAAGKGFAVVADEVRNLASRSAEAAKQTTELIQSTVSLVGNGVKVADATAQSFREIRVGTKKTTELIAEISDATSKQATAVAQVTRGIDQIAAVVQTNSATAEENAAASQDLTTQAQTLRSQVGKFRIRKEQAVPVVKLGSGERNRYPEKRHPSSDEKYA